MGSLLADSDTLGHLAERWVKQYGHAAPALIRSWARESSSDRSGAQLLETVAAIAEQVLQSDRGAQR